MHPTRFVSRRLAALFVPTAIALAACGGSDDPPAAAAPLPAGASLTLSGTAATGAAIAGGAVASRCHGGSGSATTLADGSYKIDLGEGALPCVLRVTSADGATVLHSLASGSGNTATANITPVSELIVAHLAGGSAADFYRDVDLAAGALASDKVQAAAAAVVATLKSAGVDLSALGDVLSAPLVAASGASAGNGFDQLLDQLKTQLAAGGTTLAALTDSVARASPQATAASLSAVPSLPAELLLRPAAPNCAALRSGTYRLVFFAPGEAGQAFTETMVLDAPTLQTTGSDGEVSALTATGNCQYTVPSLGEMVVTPAGVAVFRSGERPGFVAAMAFPEQQHPVSVTAGTWNVLGLGDTNGTFGPPHLFGGEMTVDSEGKVTKDIFCDDVTTCIEEAPDARLNFTVNANGGFDSDGYRAFAYRAGGGELMIVSIDVDGSFALATRKVARTLPDVGSINRSWNFTITPQYTSPNPLSSSENTVVSHAGDGASYLRNAVIDFTSGATRPETVQINIPRDGFNRRVPETVITSTGGSLVVGEWVALTLRGIGIVPVAFPASNQMVLSVNKPAP